MSAFICEPETFCSVVSTILEYEKPGGLGPYCPRPASLEGLSPQEICTKLAELNVRSVNQRYNENSPALVVKFSRNYTDSVIQRLKSLRCFLYQSCEGDCMESDLYQELEEMSARLALHVVSRLPQYESARWG